jgi:hypothetical protein
MTRIPVFTLIETPSQIRTFESFVFTFYLNERNFGTNQAFGGYRKILYFRNAIQQHEG